MRKILIWRPGPLFLAKEKVASAWLWAKRAALSLSVTLTTVMFMPITAFAADGDTADSWSAEGKDIWQWLTYALADLYGKFISVSTITACVAASICLLMMNFSTDDRAVSSARSWLKRILVSWVVLNVLGFIMAYLVPLTNGGKFVLSGGDSQ